MNTFTRAFTSLKFKAVDKSPEILIVAGVASLIAAGVSLWKARPKYEAILDRHAEEEAQIEEALERAATEPVTEDYTEADAAQDRRGNYMKTAVAFVKVFAPVVLFGLGAVACFVGSSTINKKRYLTMASTYATMATNYESLQKALLAKTGGVALDKLNGDDQQAAIDNDGGEGIEKKDEVQQEFPLEATEMFFDAVSRNFEKDRSANETFLGNHQKRFTEILQQRTGEYEPGFITLNEVLKALDLPQTEAGQILGWSNYPNPEDNIKYGAAGFVSFGFREINNIAHISNSYDPTSPVLLLKFNCDKMPLIGRHGKDKLMR
jgi:hypothetical protein